MNQGADPAKSRQEAGLADQPESKMGLPNHGRSLRFLPRNASASARRRDVLRYAALVPVLVLVAVVTAVPFLTPAARPTPTPQATRSAAAETSDSALDTAEPTIDLSGWTLAPTDSPILVASASPADGGGGGGASGWWHAISWTVPAAKGGRTATIWVSGLGNGWCGAWAVYPDAPAQYGKGFRQATSTSDKPDASGRRSIDFWPMEDYTGIVDFQMTCYQFPAPSFSGAHLFHIPVPVAPHDPWSFTIAPGPAIAGQTLSITLRVDDPASRDWAGAGGYCDIVFSLPGGYSMSAQHQWFIDAMARVLEIGAIPATTPTGTGTWSATCTDMYKIGYSETGSFPVQGNEGPPASTAEPTPAEPTPAPTEQPTSPPPTEPPVTEPPATPTPGASS